MSIIWPSDLPQIPLAGSSYSEKFGNNVLRSSMEIGPAKQRRRTTSTPDVLAVKFEMTGPQTIIFSEFYKDTLGMGTLVFNWVNPRTGESAQFRFVNDEPPSIVHDVADNYQIGFNLEQMQ